VPRLIALTLFAVALRAAASDGFVLVKGGPADPFEICDHPVTNTEYRRFVDATKHAPPLHWSNGIIPAGLENHPVIFVNRYDAGAYLKWRSRAEGRRYRLPTWAEFDYAARAGRANTKYPWGDEPPDTRSNYDAQGVRTFAEWRTHLKPVPSYPPNALGLFDMAGNVWQMVDAYPDPAVVRFKYRITDPVELENGIAGGSWARSEYYLRNGVRGGASPGIRHPDIGFRVVRQPDGMTHFERTVRRLAATAAGPGAVSLSWQLLSGDSEQTSFHIYRSRRRDTAGERIASTRVTSFTDTAAPAGSRLYYRVRAVVAGREGPPSEWAGVETGAAAGLVARFSASTKEGGAIPVFGDLDGDGVLDAVLRLDNGHREMSRDPGVPVELEAFTSYGRQLWRRPLVSHDRNFGSANNVPVLLWDLDQDGRSEVICRYQQGADVYLAVLDGMTGEVLRKTPWAAMATDFSKSSTRIHAAIAFLDGKSPSIITQTGLYENEILEAFSADLRKLWRFDSFAETSGSGSHHIDIADVDGDGRDEVFDGTTVLTPEGKVKWSIYREHPDIVAIKNIIPGRRGRQVFFAVETSVHAGAYVVDAATGSIIWKTNREDDPRWTHAHIGWAADIWAGSPGIEMLTNRDGHEAKDLVLFASDGRIIMNPFPPGWRPVNWTGGPVRDLMSPNGRMLGRFTGAAVESLSTPGPNESERGACVMTADLIGDFRDEVVCTGADAEGHPTVSVYTNTAAVERREVTRTANREYRLWMARNLGGGYGAYFEWEP
jgi:rhamnogalacturonan endolyase